MEFARAACLCQLRVAQSHDLPLLQDLFLHSGTPPEIASRGETLRMLLDLSRCRPGEPIGQGDFRQVIYFRELEGSRYEPRPELVDVARRWRVYQGREYFGYVFNRMLRWVSRRGLAETDAGLTLLPSSRLRELVTRALDDSAADPDLGLALPEVGADTRVTGFLAALTGEVDADAGADGVWPRHEGLDEQALYRACRDFDTDDGRTLIALVALVLLLRERFGLPRRAPSSARSRAFLPREDRCATGWRGSCTCSTSGCCATPPWPSCPGG
jgi:hypothetical protein